ncbi:taste receptor type 2 member 2-like [Phaethornis superciliosus]
MEACSSQGKFNVTTYNAVAMAIITLQTFAGMWINAFIVSVLCVAWGKKRSFSSNEKILLFLGCTRFCLLCITCVFTFIEYFYPFCMYVYPVTQLLLGTQNFFSVSSLWVSAFLSVFYCIKIANFRHAFFIYLKVKIDRMVPWLILASILLALGSGIFFYMVIEESLCDNNCTSPEYFWKDSYKTHQHMLLFLFLSGFAYSTAFAAVISSAILLLFSLWRHKHRMQIKSGKNISMDAHIKAMKSILSFFFIYSINFICLVFSLIYAANKESTTPILIVVLLLAFPAVHSLILIFSNPKLEKTLLRTLYCLKCNICMK